MNHPSNWSLNCPIPISADSERISLAHGEGARLSRRLIAETILPRVASAEHTAFADAARVTTIGCRLAICTDSHTVSPLFFPGGDLGSLSVYGTVNDLAVAGAYPRWLTLSLIIEEGLPKVILETVLDSVARAARECRVAIVAGAFLLIRAVLEKSWIRHRRDLGRFESVIKSLSPVRSAAMA